MSAYIPTRTLSVPVLSPGAHLRGDAFVAEAVIQLGVVGAVGSSWRLCHAHHRRRRHRRPHPIYIPHHQLNLRHTPSRLLGATDVQPSQYSEAV